jgi:RNA polymerase sigma-70 factor (sigma-E family)
MIRASMQAVETIGCRLRDALHAWCAIAVPVPALAWPSGDVTANDLTMTGAVAPALDVDRFVADLFRAEGGSLVRLARLFVDDRNAAEDLVQEAFIRLARSARRIEDPARAPAYLRSIVLNLARDHNRRGLVSLRHRSPIMDQQAGVDEELAVRDDQRQVLDALRELPARQRACLVLRYYDELGIDDIAATLGVSRNSVKTHLQRGLDGLEAHLTADREVAL